MCSLEKPKLEVIGQQAVMGMSTQDLKLAVINGPNWVTLQQIAIELANRVLKS